MNAAADRRSGSPLEHGFGLGELRVDPQGGEVRGPGGRQQLEPKVMGVLAMLAERAGQVVPREDLLARLWPDVVVSDDSLSRCLYELRRQLSLAGGTDDYRAVVETLPKRGYRLNAEVTPLAAPSLPKTARARWRQVAGWALAVAAVGLVVAYLAGRTEPARASIAVLPFTDMSETQDQQYFADGLAEEILDRLNRSSSLRVIARTSSFWFRDKDMDIAEIGRRLEVTHVLEGSVRRSGEAVRVTAQLISTVDSSHVWSTTFDRRMGELFAIQDEIATAVATSLEAALDPGRLPERLRPDLTAYDLVKQGEYLYFRRAPGDIERSVDMFERAVELDPAYARAWADLAGAYAFQAWATDPPSELLRARQGQAAHRAAELDPSLAIAQVRLGQFYIESGDFENGRKHYGNASRLDPDDPQVLGRMAGNALIAGNFDESVALHRRGLLRDPMNALLRQNFGIALIAAGRLDEALASFGTLLEINPDLDPDVRIELPRILVLQARYEEAAAEAMRLPEGKYRDQAMALLHRAPAYRDEADAALQRLVSYVPAPPLDTPMHTIMDSIRLAEIYAYRGQADRALDTITGKLDSLHGHPETSYYSWRFRNESRLSPFLKPLHADPRWIELITGPDRIRH